jgi:DNA-binding MarR family transcriptional regulator
MNFGFLYRYLIILLLDIINGFNIGGIYMKIAVMGASDSVEKVYKVLSPEHKDIEFIKYAEDEIKKLIDMTKNMDSEIDGIFLTGIGVYSEITSKARLEKPVVYTERGIIGIIKALLEFYTECGDTKNTRIALDIIEEKDLIDVLNEFNIEIKSYDIQKYLPSKNEEDYLKYYLEKYEEGNIDCIFTSFGYIYNYLKKHNIPVYRIQATNIDIKNRFFKLKNSVNLKNLNECAIQVQIIQVVEENVGTQDSKNSDSQLEEEILIYSKEIEGMMQTISSNEYLIISNKGAALSVENINSLYRIINNCKLRNIILGVGIGEGVTIYQSENNARNALRKSTSERQGNIYFYDGENVVGPIFKKNQIKYKNLVDEETLKLSKEIGISYQYIEKISSVIKKLGRDEFTSKELAEILFISERSANRILKSLIDKGYGEESNIENSLSAGRPRRKVKIKLKS